MRHKSCAVTSTRHNDDDGCRVPGVHARGHQSCTEALTARIANARVAYLLTSRACTLADGWVYIESN